MAINVEMIVQAIAKGFDKVTGEVKDVGKSVEQAGDSAKSGGLRFTELASALSIAQQGFQVVASAAKFAYDNIKQGAQLELARNQFDNLAASIGTTSDALLTDLKQATNGMQSDAQLIAGATDIINLGLADTQEGTVRLATAVSTLGLDMQQVILTFANNSKARLDALGLSVSGVTEKAAELEAQGFQGDAFDEAVLIGLEEKMTLLGDASETTAGQLQILESDWANLTNELKQGAAEIAGPVVSAIVANRKEAALLEDAYNKGLITYLEYQQGVSATSEGIKTAAQVLTEYNLVLDENGNVIGTVVNGHERLTAKLEKETGAVEEVTEAYVQQDATLRAVNRALLDFSGDLGPTTRELEEMAYASGDAASSKDQLADGIDRARAAMEAEAEAAAEAAAAEEAAAQAAKDHAASMGDLFTQAIESEGGIGLFNETAAQMADRSIFVSDLTGEQRDALSDLQSEYEKAQGIIADYTLGAKGVGLTTDEVNEKVTEQQERMAALQGAMDPLLAVGGDYADVQGTMTINQGALNQAVYDAADASGASAEQLAILGGALGLYSDEAVEAALKSAAIQAKIDELAQSYVDGKISVEDMRTGIQDFITALDEVPSAVSTDVSVTGVDNAIAKVGSLQAQLDALGGQVSAAEAAGATQRGTGNTANIGFASGGFTGFGNPADVAGVVHKNELVVPPNVLAGGMQAIQRFASQNVPGAAGGSMQALGGNQITNNFNVYQRPGENGRAFADRVATLVNERNGSLK